MPPRDYARLHFDWYRDDVLETIADEEPAALWIWPVLIGMAKEKSHATTNPLGVFEKSAAGIGKAAHVPADQVQRALDLLVEGEFIRTSPADKPRVLRIELVAFDRWQTPRKGAAEREQKRRDASREKVPSRDGDVTGALRSVVLETETGDVEVSSSLRSLSLADSVDEPVTVRKKKEPKPTPFPKPTADEIDDVIRWWAETFGHVVEDPRAVKGRRDRVRWAWSQYGKTRLARCLQGYASDPWWMGAVTRNKLTTLLKNAEAFEAGESLWKQSRDGAGPAASGIDMGYER